MFNYVLSEIFELGSCGVINELLEDEITSFSDIFNKMFDENDYIENIIDIHPYKILGTKIIFKLPNFSIIKDIKFNLPINDIKLEIGGSTIEQLYDDIQQKICSSLKGNEYCLFFDTIPIYQHEYHEAIITVNIDSEILGNDIKINAKSYALNNNGYKKLPKKIYMDYLTIQNQNDNFVIKKGINIIRLNFRHPGFLLYFYGCNKEKVKNIKLKFNYQIYYDGPISNLDSDIDPNISVIIFSDNFDKKNLYLNKAVNFSMMSYVSLIIDTEQSEESEIYIGLLSYQVVKSMNNMLGVTFG